MLGLGTAIVTSGTVLESALLDDFGGAAVGYSVRRLNSDYYGPCMRVRRDSDNAERDIYFGADDILDTATLEDFCDGTDGYVVRWYNQTESYESVKLLNQSYASSPEAAYSVRQLDSSYDGPCMEVASSDDVIGFRMTEDQVDPGNLALKYTDTSAYSGGATVFTGEIYVDAPSHIAASKNVRFRLQMIKSGGGVALANYVVVSPANQKKWIKATWTLNAVPVENGFSLVHDRTNGTDFLKGEQVLIRNIEATGYTAVYDEDDYSVTNFADEAEIIKGYNIPFTADGDLDEAKIVEHGYASPFECLEIDVVDTTDATGDYRINILGADTITGDPSASGTYTVTTEIYVDCPSISGAVTFKGQIGGATRNFDEGNTVAQKQWVTKTMSLTVGTSNVQSRIYFAGTVQAPQELEEGDKIYFRRIVLNHSEDSTYNAELDFTSSADGVTYSFPSGGDGDATLSHGKSPAEELGVITWYDQSGNGNDATQTTFADTPSIYQYNSTTKDYRVVKENDSPALTDFVEGDGMDFSTTISVTDQSIIFVGEVKTDSILIGNDDYAFWTRGTETTFRVNGTFHKFNASTRSAHTHLGYYRDGSTVSAFQDGSSLGTANGTPASDAASDYTGIAIYGRADANLGKYQEVIIFGEDLSSNRSDIEDNIDAHFRITNDLDATQTTTTKQPKIYDSVTGVVLENGKPAIGNWLSAQTILIASFGQTYNTVNIYSVSTENQGSSVGYIVSGDTSTGFRLGRNGQGADIWLYDGSTSKTTSAESSGQALVSVLNGVNPLGYFNGVSRTFDNTLNGNGMSGAYIGNHPTLSGLGQIDGNLQELIIYPSDKSSNRTNIEDNINDFYSIYDKSSYRLLDYYRDAAAAFSLRKLLSTYTGSAIEVRRSSDDTTQDIGFTANGDLDTAALAAFCGSNNGFVKTWYDQSVNGRDASQADTTKQPKIYDSSTGVITDNGKPATEWSAVTGQLLDTSYTTNSSEFTVVAVANCDDNGTNKTIVLAPEALVFVANNESARHIQGDAAQTPYSPADSTDQMLHFVGNSGSESFAGDNGTALTTRSESPATNSKLRIGNNAVGSIPFLGKIQEIVYYTSDQSGSRSDIEANVNQYYSIY